MKSSVIKHPKSQWEISVELTIEEFRSFLDQSEKDFFQKTNLPGFRPNKAPLDLLRREIGETKIYDQAAQLAIEKTYWQIIQQEKIEPLEAPKVEIQKLAPQNPFIYKARVTVLPKVQLGNFKKIKVERKKIKVEKEKIEKLLYDLQMSRRKETLVTRPVQKGDHLEMDIEMFLNKVPLENGQMKNVSYFVGEAYYLPDLEKELIGLKSGESKSFSLTYPTDYADRHLAGKIVDFKVKINSVYQIDLPEVNDEFARGLGNFKNLEELKNQLADNFKKELEIKEEKKMELEILEKLVNLSSFEDEEIPEILVESEIDKMFEELESYLVQQNLKFSDYLTHLKKTEEDLRKNFRAQSEKRVKTSLILREIGKIHQIFVDETEIDREVAKLLNYYQDDPEAKKNIPSEKHRNYLKNFLANQKIIDWLKKQVTILSE